MILDKLDQPFTHLNCDELTPNQKKHLWEVMMRHGASQGFAYDRFFKEGFSEWELRGVEKIKKDFLKEHERELWTEPDVEGVVGYSAILAFLDEGNDNFYNIIGRARLKLVFVNYMAELGMGANTVLRRFGKEEEQDFKDYERIGIRAVIAEFEQEVKENNIV